MSHRPEQLISSIHRAVQAVLSRGINDPRITGLVSVTKVELSHDKRTATVHVSVVPADRAALVLHGLKSATRHIRSKIGEAIAVRRLPQIDFAIDESLKKQAAVHAAIQRGLAREASNASETPPGDEMTPPAHDMPGEDAEPYTQPRDPGQHGSAPRTNNFTD